MGRGWLAAALAALLAAPPATGAEPQPGLLPSLAQQDGVERHALLFPTERGPRLLQERLRISGIDPADVARTLEAYNRRSEIAQFTPDGLAVAPQLLNRALSLQPNQLLQFRWSGQAGKLVFRFTWR
jgi:multidrug efflux pump subunit AcrB